MPTALDQSAEDLDNPLAPHVQRRQQIQSEALLNLALQRAEGQHLQAQPQEEALRLQNEQGQTQINQAALPGDIAAAKQQSDRTATLPIATSDFMAHMLPQNFHHEGAAPDSPYETGNPYRAMFPQAPPEAQRHAIDAYGPVLGPEVWNKTATEMGVPPQETGTQSRVLDSRLAAAGVEVPPNATHQEKIDAWTAHQEDLQRQKEEKTTATQDMQQGRQKLMARRMILTGKRSPQVVAYQNAKTNYDSIKQNVDKKNRTGADDAFLLEAAGAIEHPGYALSSEDIKLLLRSAGIKSNVDTTAGRIAAVFEGGPDAAAKSGRLFDDQTAHAIHDAAKRSVKLRRAQYDSAIAPLIDAAEASGLDPEKAIGPDAYKDEFTDEEAGEPTGPQSYNSISEAEAAQKAGKIKDGDKVLIGGIPHTWHD